MTTTSDLALLSIEDVAKLIATKQVSPVELTEQMLARIEQRNPQLNACLTVTAEQARAAARQAEAEITAGGARGTLHGVPVAIKDLFDTKGVPTTAGSKIFADRVPDDDATVVRKLDEAGAIGLGKLGMHEWAFGITSDNLHFGPVRNPWDPERIPGGSSGGSGAATAAGLAYATLGSDTGGSIRIPAAFCGCVGLMPTYGRASLHGAVPLSWSLDHAGPLTRTVRDAAIVLGTISGYDPRDPASEDRPVPDWLEGIERGPKGLRIGVPSAYYWDELDPEVERVCRAALASLEAAGASLREVDGPAVAVPDVINVMFVEAAAYHAPHFPSRRADYSPQVAALLDAGSQIPATAYAQSVRAMHLARGGAADAALDGVDVLAFPTVPVPAPTIAETRAGDPSMHIVRTTAPIDFTGQPAIAVPAGLTSQNLPVSLSFVGRRWDEAAVVWAGRALELVRGPFPAPPLA
ncbi:MAG TPA: amidase [Dehalococcoidia bacterium]|nr:amidase [Dehalococcoidia bacterium]